MVQEEFRKAKVYVGPKQNLNALTLRSIAKTIEPVYPSSAEELRSIAAHLEEELDRSK